MNTRSHGDWRHAGVARRLLTCLLTVLFLVQPVARLSSACSLNGSPFGSEACCCSDSMPVATVSCCSVAGPSDVSTDTPVLSLGNHCTCEVQAPVPFPAVAPEPGLQSKERGIDGGFARWIEFGALMSSSTPFLEWARPIQQSDLALSSGLRPPAGPVVVGPSGRPRGLLALICVARC